MRSARLPENLTSSLQGQTARTYYSGMGCSQKEESCSTLYWLIPR